MTAAPDMNLSDLILLLFVVLALAIAFLYGASIVNFLNENKVAVSVGIVLGIILTKLYYRLRSIFRHSRHSNHRFHSHRRFR